MAVCSATRLLPFDTQLAILDRLNAMDHAPLSENDVARINTLLAQIRATLSRTPTPAGSLKLPAHYDYSDFAFSEGPLAHLIFDHALLRGVDFSKRDLTATKFTHCDLTGANLCAAKLDHTTLEHCTLDRATFEGATLAGAAVIGCKLNGTSFYRCTFAPQTQFTGCTGAGASLSNANIEGLSIRSADLPRCSFSQADIKRLTLEGPDLKLYWANFRDSTATGFTASGADLRNADFSGAILNGVQFAKVGCIDSAWCGSEVRSSDFQGVDLRGADLSDAKLQGSTFAGIKLHDAKLWSTQGLHGRNKATIDTETLIGAEYAKYGKPRDRWAWHHLRLIGSFPLFGVSNFAVIAILLLATSVHWYNRQIEALRGDPGIADSVPWVRGLKEMTLSPSFGITLVAIGCIAAGAGIYKFKCPTIVQEYTQSAWTIDRAKPVTEYLALAYSLPMTRRACAVLYAVGGLWTALYLLWRFCFALYVIFWSAG